MVLVYYATMLAVVSLLQHMADTESWGFVWLLISMLLALLMPYTVQEGSAVPALHTVFLNEAGVTYCMITPVILGTLLMFPDAVDRRTLSEVSFVGLIFGLINVVVWFGLAPHSWWMGVLHLPLVIIATFALAEARLHKQQPATVVSE